MTAPASCPKCSAPLAPDEKFCGKCGYQVRVNPEDARDIGARIGLKHEKQRHQQQIRSGRTTILVVAILTVVGAVAFYLIGSASIQKAQKEIDGARGNERFDQEKVEEAHRENKKASGLNTILAAVNFVLALCFFGLWIWAKHRPLPATLAALILYVTVLVASGVFDPTMLVKGIIVKAAIILFLVKAVDSARKFQRMQEHGI
ncbi:MAG TPA: zinc-ribbon domain-containing protein [Planctomycetota bacterium]|nr:zinc-ribbon domain-containing protein [Planctomycetota bacterium]